MIFKSPKSCGNTKRALHLLASGELSQRDRQRLLEHTSQCADCRASIREAARAGRLLRMHMPPACTAHPTPECPDCETLASLAEGSATPETRRHWGTHVAECQACLTAIHQLRQTIEGAAAPDELERLAAEVARQGVSRPHSGRSWHLSLLAGAAAVLVAVLLWGPRERNAPTETPSGAPLVANHVVSEPRLIDEPTAPERPVWEPAGDDERKPNPTRRPLLPRPDRNVQPASRSLESVAEKPAGTPRHNKLPHKALAVAGTDPDLAELAKANSLPTGLSLATPGSRKPWQALHREPPSDFVPANVLPNVAPRMFRADPAAKSLINVMPRLDKRMLVDPRRKQMLSADGRQED